MMHVHMIGAAIVLAFVSRWLSGSVLPNAEHDQRKLFARVQDGPIGRSWTVRWNSALSAFVVPPLLLLTTAVAIVSMGARSCHVWEGWLSYQIAWLFLIVAAGVWASLMWKVFKMRRELRRHPQRFISSGSGTGIGDTIGQVLPGTSIFSAQIGLWSSELVVSEGLLARLDEEHLAAVLAHESGHDHYRDTFWFFWLGGLRRLTFWLPYSEELWQELLLLREIRADRWAVQWVDALVLAESLMSVVSAPLMSESLMSEESVCAGFSCAAPRSRLSERVDALLAHEDVSRASVMEPSVSHPFAANMPSKSWMELALAMTPLLTIPLHH